MFQDDESFSLVKFRDEGSSTNKQTKMVNQLGGIVTTLDEDGELTLEVGDVSSC